MPLIAARRLAWVNEVLEEVRNVFILVLDIVHGGLK